MTLRQWIKSNGGSLTQALVKAIESNSLEDLLYAYSKADSQNRDKIETVFPGIKEMFEATIKWYSIEQGICFAFPALKNLDVENEDAWKVDVLVAP